MYDERSQWKNQQEDKQGFIERVLKRFGPDIRRLQLLF